MKKVLLIAIMSCLAIAALAHAAPKVHVDDPVYDFGSTLEGFAVTHVYTIENAGDQILEIYRVAASCGCTTTALATHRLAPGESVDLQIVIDTSGFSGRISKAVYLYVNDPDYADSFSSERPRFTLRITGEVMRAQTYHTSISDMNYLFYLLVDLRDPTAYDAAHLIGAVSIPADVLADSLDVLPSDAFIVLYDQTGEASKDMASYLASEGYTTAYYTLGGLDEWLRWYGTYLVRTAVEPLVTPSREGEVRLVCPDDDRACTSIAELRYLIYVLIDLRDPAAYEASHLFGAINVPFTDIGARLSELPKDALIIVYDDANEQSDAVARMMLDAGFTQARSLLGGLGEWIRQFSGRFVIGDSE